MDEAITVKNFISNLELKFRAQVSLKFLLVN